MACGRVLGTALPAISNGRVRKIFEQSPNSMAPARCCGWASRNSDQGPTSMWCMSRCSRAAARVVAWGRAQKTRA